MLSYELRAVKLAGLSADGMTKNVGYLAIFGSKAEISQRNFESGSAAVRPSIDVPEGFLRLAKLAVRVLAWKGDDWIAKKERPAKLAGRFGQFPQIRLMAWAFRRPVPFWDRGSIVSAEFLSALSKCADPKRHRAGGA